MRGLDKISNDKLKSFTTFATFYFFASTSPALENPSCHFSRSNETDAFAARTENNSELKFILKSFNTNVMLF